MKTLINLLVALFAVSIFVSCESGKKENEAAKEEVIGIHDEVMPLMGELKAKQKELQSKAESLAMEEDTARHQEKIQELRSVADQLDKAYEGMFVWMRQFKADYEGMSDQEVADYLKEQKEAVTKVNEDIKAALEKAETYEE